MKRRLLLDVVIGKSTPILELLPSKDEALLVRRDSLLVLNLRLHIVDSVRRLHFQRDGFARESLYENLHTTAKTEDEMKSGLLLDVVVGQSTTIFQLLAGENETLLVRRDTLLVLNLGFDVVDGVRRFDLQGDRLTRQGLHEDLHSATETKHEMEGGLLLNVVIREGATILELLSSEDQALLVGRDTLLVLNLGLYIIDGVGSTSLMMCSTLLKARST